MGDYRKSFGRELQWDLEAVEELPRAGNAREDTSSWAAAPLKDFMEADVEIARFAAAWPAGTTEQQLKAVQSNLRGAIRRLELPVMVSCRGGEIFLVRTDKGEGARNGRGSKKA